jgi:hypothetical protein
MEAQHSAFLYRSPVLEKISSEKNGWRYETESLRFYRKALEQKAPEKHGGDDGVFVFSLPGRRTISPFAGASGKSASEFLASYKRKIEKLSSFDDDGECGDETRNVATTLLPVAASIRRQNPLTADLFEETKNWCAAELEKVIARL